MPSPPPAKKQKKYANYSDPAVAAALQEAVDFYVSTGGNFPTPGDYMLTNHPFINIPKRKIKRHAEKKKPPPPG